MFRFLYEFVLTLVIGGSILGIIWFFHTYQTAYEWAAQISAILVTSLLIGGFIRGLIWLIKQLLEE